MAVSSMTGFARADGEVEGISWAWELKSVNGKSLDLRLRLPPGFDALEPQLRASLAKRVRRGNVSANLAVSRTTPPAIRINRDMLGRYVALASELATEIKAEPPRLDGLIGLRGVIETAEDEPEAIVETRRQAVVDGWETALDRLYAVRAEEGARLDAVLQGQLAELSSLVAAASASAAAQPAAIRARLETLIGELAGLGPNMPKVPEDRVAQEVAMLVSRSDIREELDRLRAHVAQAAELLGR